MYYKKIDTYKLKVLNKINNLKRFFFFRNNNKEGWWIFRFINSFSFQFHIKHLLWHSPYYYLFYKNFFFLDKENYDNNIFLYYDFCYKFESNFIIIEKYSLIFNLFLNVIEIKDVLALNSISYKIKGNFISISFNNYFKFGYSDSISLNFHYLDIYRLVINLLYDYYYNFLYKLTRYRYILDYKNYNSWVFIKRYFNFIDWFYHSYIRLRIQIYRYLFYGKSIKRFYMKTFKLKNLHSHRMRRMQIIPYWFFFDYYTKLFIYFILNVYYTKINLIFYWFFMFFSCDFKWFIYFNFKYNIKLKILNYLINYYNNLKTIFLLRHYNNILNTIEWILHKIILYVYTWYHVYTYNIFFSYMYMYWVDFYFYTFIFLDSIAIIKEGDNRIYYDSEVYKMLYFPFFLIYKVLYITLFKGFIENFNRGLPEAKLDVINLYNYIYKCVYNYFKYKFDKLTFAQKMRILKSYVYIRDIIYDVKYWFNSYINFFISWIKSLIQLIFKLILYIYKKIIIVYKISKFKYRSYKSMLLIKFKKYLELYKFILLIEFKKYLEFKKYFKWYLNIIIVLNLIILFILII